MLETERQSVYTDAMRLDALFMDLRESVQNGTGGIHYTSM